MIKLPTSIYSLQCLEHTVMIMGEMAISSPITLIPFNHVNFRTPKPISLAKICKSYVNILGPAYSFLGYTTDFSSSSLIRLAKTSSKPLLNVVALAQKTSHFHCRNAGNLNSCCVSCPKISSKNPYSRDDIFNSAIPCRSSSWRIRAQDDDVEGEDEEDEEADNLKDFEVQYDMKGDEIEMVQSETFVSTEGWEPEMVVDYKIDEDEFHKISLLDCDFFIRKVPDPDGNVYDFREMYVTPPDTDVYSIPEVVGEIPKKYVRLRKSDFNYINVSEPPVDHPRAPLYKTEMEVMKVFLMKHFRNRKARDRNFVLDLEEIYVIDSKTKSISRANVVVKVPGGRDRDRTNEVLIVRDNGTSFKIIPADKQDDPDTVIEVMQWERSKEKMENYLRGFRDYEISNWF